MALALGCHERRGRGSRRVPRARLRSHERWTASLPFLAAPLLLILISVPPLRAEFNFEVGRRIHERVSGFMKTPTSILHQISRYRDNKGFPHDLRAPDRNAFFRLNDALMETYPEFQSIYYGLEDGMFAGHGFSSKIANYREPGHSGYLIDDGTNVAVDYENMQKHYVGCVNATSGEALPCEMKAGGKYTECVNDCQLEKCADEDSQRDCEAISSDLEEKSACEERIKWCTSYTIKESTEDVRRGYVVRSTHCINSHGVPSETPGEIVKKGLDELGSCHYSDTDILVQRKNISGDYAYCGGEGRVCNDVFSGGYISRDYDPRWRGWYIATKALQVPNWSPPYAFFTAAEIGITFSFPIYTKNDFGQNVFEGVLAVDFTFTDISNFLTANYKDSSTVIAIFEQAEPHYVVATSTESTGVRKVLKENEDIPCPSPESDCKAIRVPAGELAETEMDAIIRAAFSRQKDAGFPEEQLISSKPENDDTIFASQVKSFSIPDADLSWQIMIMMPIATEESDTIVMGDQLFGFLVAIVCLGVFISCVLLEQLIKRRKERAVILGDWRFLSAFLVSCAFLNLSCLSFLGPNTDSLCLLRQWLVHFFFAMAMSLLFAKTYRMYKLVGAADSFRAATISHADTVKLALPLVALQTIILLIFTFFDPSKETEVIETNGSDITHRVICSHDTPAFFVTMLIYEGGLLAVGCILAFKTRNLQSEFNESKQIILSMYDTAVIATSLLVVSNVALTYQGEQRLLVTLGIFWITCFASFVFVLPRTKSNPSQAVMSTISAISQQVSRSSNRAEPISDVEMNGQSTTSVSNASITNLTVAEIRRRSMYVKSVPNSSPVTEEGKATVDESSSNGSKTTSVDVEVGSARAKRVSFERASGEELDVSAIAGKEGKTVAPRGTSSNGIPENNQNVAGSALMTGEKSVSFKQENISESDQNVQGDELPGEKQDAIPAEWAWIDSHSSSK